MLPEPRRRPRTASRAGFPSQASVANHHRTCLRPSFAESRARSLDAGDSGVEAPAVDRTLCPCRVETAALQLEDYESPNLTFWKPVKFSHSSRPFDREGLAARGSDAEAVPPSAGHPRHIRLACVPGRRG